MSAIDKEGFTSIVMRKVVEYGVAWRGLVKVDRGFSHIDSLLSVSIDRYEAAYILRWWQHKGDESLRRIPACVSTRPMPNSTYAVPRNVLLPLDVGYGDIEC